MFFFLKDYLKKVGYHLCMTHLEEQFKEGIFENS